MSEREAVEAAGADPPAPPAKRLRARPKYPPRGNRFEGRVVLVTGAAGNFGGVCARMAAAEGAAVALVDVAAEGLREVEEDLRGAYGVPVRAFTVDVTKEDQVRSMVQEARREFGRIDGLFNNAGYQGDFAPVDQYSADDFDKVMRINVTGVFAVLKHVSQVMIEQGRGAIVNTASCAGLGCPTSMPAYGSSKAAVLHLTKIAAADLDGFMWRRQVELQARANPTGAPEFYYPDRPDAVARQMVASVPLRRLGTPEEVIQTVLFLLSDDSSYITGVDINVSGGNVLGGSRG